VEENREAVRHDIHGPMQVCISQRPPQFHGGQLRDISRTGICSTGRFLSRLERRWNSRFVCRRNRSAILACWLAPR